MTLFAESAVELSVIGLRAIATSRVMKFFGYWALLAYVGSKYVKADWYTPPKAAGEWGGKLYFAELCVYEAIWWLVLGILSSVGFGTGLHSGVMFLWPFTMTMVLNAQEGSSRRSRGPRPAAHALLPTPC